MPIGFCAKCQQRLSPGAWAMVNGKKFCNACLEEQNSQSFSNTARSKENDKLKKDFFAYLLSLFPNLSAIPEHWHSQVTTMLKRGWSIKGIKNTLVYCDLQGKTITEENWSTIVYVYYNEAEKWVNHLREMKEKNKQVDLTAETITIPFHATTYRDMPEYKMEDL